MAAYRRRVAKERWPIDANAMETSSAKIIIAPKWLGWILIPGTQPLRPRAMPYASSAPRRFTIPAAAMSRVP